jgi:hypothetical protein
LGKSRRCKGEKRSERWRGRGSGATCRGRLVDRWVDIHTRQKHRQREEERKEKERDRKEREREEREEREREREREEEGEIKQQRCMSQAVL